MLENLILKEHNITKALELVHNDPLLPVFIPSYKNRKGSMIDRLDQIPGEVHLFLYDDDRHNYPETFPDNVTVHLIHRTENWCGLASKREYMLEWKKANGIHKCIEIDDDVNFSIKYPVKNGDKNDVGIGSLWDMLKLYARLLEPYGNTFGVAGFHGNCRGYNWKKIITPHRAYACVCIIQNVDALKENDVHYPTEVKGGEDVEIAMECALKGLKVPGLEFVNHVTCDIKIGGKNTIANTKEIGNNFSIHYFKKYKGFVKVMPDVERERIWVKMDWKKILANDNSYDETLMKACEENNLEKIFEALGKPLPIKKDFKDLKMELYPVCIPTYKNRKIAKLLDQVNDIEGPVYIFKYADDDYSNRDFGKNVTVVNITEEDFRQLGLEWRGITPKRHFIQHYMLAKGIDYYFMIDDDFRTFYINNGEKVNIGINEGLRIMQECFEPDMLGLVCNPYEKVKPYTDGKNLRDAYLYSCFILNGKLAEENQIKFSKLKNVEDDWNFSYLGYMKGLRTYKTLELGATTAPETAKGGSTFSDEHRELLRVNNFLQFPDFFILYLNNGELKGRVIFRPTEAAEVINKVKIPKTKLQKDLYEVCKTQDLKAIKDFLKLNGGTSVDFDKKQLIQSAKEDHKRELEEW